MRILGPFTIPQRAYQDRISHTLHGTLMDPFITLPWFVLRDILSLLPNLPTLHCLYQASPAIAAYLNHDPGTFPAIVEEIIAHTDRDQGLNPKVQFYLRTLVFIWWRASATNEDNAIPLPLSFEEVAYFLGKSGPNAQTLPRGFGDTSLPRATPPVVLCRLLAFSAKLRQTTHACFHDWMTRCKILKPERMKNPDEEFSDPSLSPRPSGVPFTPVDIGPPSWLEEQRMMRAILRYFLFYELKDALKSQDLQMSNDHPDYGTLETDQVETFWCGTVSTQYPRLATQQRAQFQAVLPWLRQHDPVRPELQYCCPEPTLLSPKQWSLPDDPQMNFVPGYTFRVKLQGVRSPLRGLDSTPFQQLGFDFWDEERMVALGFMSPLHGNTLSLDSRDERDLQYRWSSILTQVQWDRFIQQKR